MDAEEIVMYIQDYSMVREGTDDEDCEIKNVRFAKADLKGAVITAVSKDEITIRLTGYRAGDLVHIHPGDDCFQFSTIEGGRS
jgi:hypothetical protein